MGRADRKNTRHRRERKTTRDAEANDTHTIRRERTAGPSRSRSRPPPPPWPRGRRRPATPCFFRGCAQRTGVARRRRRSRNGRKGGVTATRIVHRSPRRGDNDVARGDAARRGGGLSLRARARGVARGAIVSVRGSRPRVSVRSRRRGEEERAKTVAPITTRAGTGASRPERVDKLEAGCWLWPDFKTSTPTETRGGEAPSTGGGGGAAAAGGGERRRGTARHARDDDAA